MLERSAFGRSILAGVVVLAAALPALGAYAANLSWSSDTTVSLTDPAINLTIKSGSVADSLIVNSTSAVVGMSGSTGGSFTITSASRNMDVSVSSISGSAPVACDSSNVASTTLSLPSTYTITPSSAQCTYVAPTSYGVGTSIVAPSSGGGGGGGGGSSASVTTAATASSTASTATATSTAAVSAATSSAAAAPSGTSVSARQALLNSLLAQVQALQQQLAAKGGRAGGVSAFAKNLQLWTKSEDVRALQAHLNAKGFAVAMGGPGSAGNETTLFGPATKAALVKFQKSAGISPASGYFGPLTRKYVSEHP